MALTREMWASEVFKRDHHKCVVPGCARTPYFNFSESQNEEDGCIDNSLLLGKPLVVTVKFDGSNVTVTREKVAARNGQHAQHPSFNYLKQLHAGFKHLLPEGVKLFGEWLFAKHSIHYTGPLSAT